MKGPAHMEPMLPDDSRALQDLTFSLVGSAHAFAGGVNPALKRSMGDLIRAMNCYYSNLIEGHDTRLADIERALRNEYSAEPKKRDLQLEARAHIEVQRMIDHGEMPYPAISVEGISWLHREFCARLPESLLDIEDERTGEVVRMTPGEFRERNVIVGKHDAPEPEALPALLHRFVEAYSSPMLATPRKVVAAAASHHRFGWIHPFLDGNGRVGRLMSHAFLRELGVGSELWSVSRGLARQVDRYKALLEAADETRRGDLDGRGTLTELGLARFCAFFLETCIDQVQFMQGLLRPAELLNRVQIWTQEEMRAKRLPKGSWQLLREAILLGEFPRSQAASLTGYQERQARTVLSSLVENGYLVSDTARGDVRLGFPSDVIERWFPGLYKPGSIAVAQSTPASTEAERAGIYGTLLTLMASRGWNLPNGFADDVFIWIDEHTARQMLPKVIGAASLSDLLDEFSIRIPNHSDG